MPSNSPFTVAGMGSSTSGSSHHSHGAPWGSTSTSGTLGASLSDSFAQSRTHYQSGYMMVSLHFPGQCRLSDSECLQSSVQSNVSGNGYSAASFNIHRFVYRHSRKATSASTRCQSYKLKQSSIMLSLGEQLQTLEWSPCLRNLGLSLHSPLALNLALNIAV